MEATVAWEAGSEVVAISLRLEPLHSFLTRPAQVPAALVEFHRRLRIFVATLAYVTRRSVSRLCADWTKVKILHTSPTEYPLRATLYLLAPTMRERGLARVYRNGARAHPTTFKDFALLVCQHAVTPPPPRATRHPSPILNPPR
jgi:hypothetical protein